MRKVIISGLILSFAATGLAQQRYRVVGSSVSIHSSRPMDAAAEFVREHYGIPVSYEDPKTQFSADILDETDESYRRQNPSIRALVQKRGTIEVSLASEDLDGGEKKRAALRFLRAAPASMWHKEITATLRFWKTPWASWWCPEWPGDGGENFRRNKAHSTAK